MLTSPYSVNVVVLSEALWVFVTPQAPHSFYREQQGAPLNTEQQQGNL